MDRSNATQFNDACRAASDYNAADPTLWDMRNLQYDTYKSFLNANQQKDFIKYDKSAVFGRKLLKELISYTAVQTGAELISADSYANTLNKKVKTLIKNTRIEWETCSYYFNGKHYRVWAEGQADNWDKWIYTVDANMVVSDSYLCATGCLATTDYHSMPVVIVDDTGFIYVIHEQMDGNNHDSDMLVFKSDLAEDITGGFTQIQEIAGRLLGYPVLTKLNGNIYAFFRDTDGDGVAEYKLNTVSDEFERVGFIFNALSEGIYKTLVPNPSENKIGILIYEIDAAMTEGVYYMETVDGVNWTNAAGTVSLDVTNSEVVNDANKALFAVHEDSASYNSIISENGLFISGVPHVVIYEGNRVGLTDFITVENVYVAKFSGGAWNKYLLPYTTPHNYAQRTGFNHFLAYKSSMYYLFYVSSSYDTDIIDNTNVKLYKSADLVTWIEIDFMEADYGYIFLPTAILSPNAPADNQLVWFYIGDGDYAGPPFLEPFSQHLICKIN
jgi:hypothetical protein